MPLTQGEGRSAHFVIFLIRNASLHLQHRVVNIITAENIICMSAVYMACLKIIKIIKGVRSSITDLGSEVQSRLD